MPKANRRDAALYLKLLDITQNGVQIEARRWVFNHFAARDLAELNQNYPHGSHERNLLQNVLGFYESVGVLVSRGLLNEDLFFDNPFGFELLWPRVSPLIAEWQQAANDPAVWENVEWLGKRYEWWHEHQWKAKLQSIPPQPAPEPPKRKKQK